MPNSHDSQRLGASPESRGPKWFPILAGVILLLWTSIGGYFFAQRFPDSFVVLAVGVPIFCLAAMLMIWQGLGSFRIYQNGVLHRGVPLTFEEIE